MLMKLIPQGTVRRSGFTLIEIVIVLAITSLLAVIAIAGQDALQQRARFDAAVNKTIQNIAYVRNLAASNVNTNGGGNDPASLLIGDALELDNTHLPTYPVTEIEPIYAGPGLNGDADPSTYSNCPPDRLGPGSVCVGCPAADHPRTAEECWEQYLDLPDSITVANPGVSKVVVDYVNTSMGLEVCHAIGTGFPTIVAECAASRLVPLDIDLTDASGLTATIEVDPNSGYAKRLN